jgi:hypothetical protein
LIRLVRHDTNERTNRMEAKDKTQSFSPTSQDPATIPGIKQNSMSWSCHNNGLQLISSALFRS